MRRRNRTGNRQALRNVRGGCLMDGEQSGSDEGREQGQVGGRLRRAGSGGRRPPGGCGEGCAQWGKESSHLDTVVAGRAGVASQTLPLPSAPENQAAQCPLGWDEPLAAALPVSFPNRCSYSPACTCGLLATHTLTWHLSLAGGLLFLPWLPWPGP